MQYTTRSGSPSPCSDPFPPSFLRSAMWHTQQPSLAVTVEESGIHAWDISDQGVKVRVEG